MAKYKRVPINGKKYYRTRITKPNGKRKALYGNTLAELEAKVATERAKVPAQQSQDRPTVAEYAAMRLEIIKSSVKYNTYSDYSAKVRLYIAAPPLGNMRIDAVTADDIERAMQGVAGYSSSTYRTVHMLMRGIFGAAKRSHVIEEDPTDGLPSRGGKPKKELPALSDEHADILLTAIANLQVETFVRIGLYAGLRREEILALQWDCVHLDVDNPYIEMRRVWRIEHNRPQVSDVLKTPAARRDIPIPPTLAGYLRTKQAVSKSEYIIANSVGEPLSGTQWKRLWQQVKTRSVKEHTYSRYSSDGTKTTHTVTPVLGARAPHNPNVVYSMDFSVTPHQLRRTYITNLIFAGTDPKTVQYLAGHKSSKITMDIYAKVKYNRPDDLAATVNAAFISSSEKNQASKSDDANNSKRAN